MPKGVEPTDIGKILSKAKGIGVAPNKHRIIPELAEKIMESLRQQPISRILDIIGMSPITHASEILKGEDPLRVLGPDKAGLPFASIMKGKSVFHGTQRPWETIDYSKLDTSDVLGSMFHAAEDPAYASRGYAMGFSKGAKAIPESGSILSEKDLTTGTKFYQSGIPKLLNPRVIPLVPDAKNVLDLVDPNPDDLSHALASLGPSVREDLIKKFKDTRRFARLRPEAVEHLLPSKHYAGSESVNPKEVPIRRIAEELRLSPEEFQKTLFDAIRYRDTNQKSWAIPEGTPIRSLFGAPLTKESISPITMRRMEVGEKGNLPVLSKSKKIKEAPTVYDQYSQLDDELNTKIEYTPEGKPWESLKYGEYKKPEIKQEFKIGDKIKIVDNPIPWSFNPKGLVVIHDKKHLEGLQEFIKMGGKVKILK